MKLGSKKDGERSTFLFNFAFMFCSPRNNQFLRNGNCVFMALYLQLYPPCPTCTVCNINSKLINVSYMNAIGE